MLHATVELLREGGLRAAAPAAIADRAGAGKMSLYRHFGGKDELVTEALRDYAPAQLDAVLGPEGDGDPRRRVLAIFDRIARLADEGVLTPCIYLTTRLEVADAGHPTAPVSAEYKRSVADELARWLRKLGHAEPERTANVISMLMDGAIEHSIIAGDSGPARDARAAVETLLG